MATASLICVPPARVQYWVEEQLLLTKGGRQAVFLPQVATEFGWDRDTLLSQLSVKAGLPADGWRHGARFEVFTAQVFGERE